MNGVFRKKEETRKRIREICDFVGVPYCDVLCSKGNGEVFRCIYGENATGKEYLRMYSCSKPVTAIAAMILAERGLLHFDDEAEKYIPELSGAFLINGSGQKVFPRKKITVRHLLTMTAGFSYDVNTVPIRKLQKDNPFASLKDFISTFVQSPLSFEPGEEFRYGLCYDVLAGVIEAAAEKKFSEFVKENIFQPLEMGDSYFDNRIASCSEMYQAEENGKISLADAKNHLILSQNYESGGAGLISTVEDYAKFARFLALGGVNARGERLLGESYLKLMASEQTEKIAIKNNFTCVQGDDYCYGFGVRVRKRATDWGLPPGEYGWDGAAGSYLMIDPKNKISIVIGMNILGWPYVFSGKHTEIVHAIYNGLLQ